MTLETQVDLAESDKSSFYNQREWLKKYEHGNGVFYSEYSDDKNQTSSEDSYSDWQERSSEEDESSASNTGELPLEDSYYYGSTEEAHG